MHEWRYILTSLAGAELGELWQAGDRSLTIPLAGGPGAGTQTGTLRLDNPMVDAMIGIDAASRLEVLVKAYRDGTLMFTGDLQAGEEIADQGNETFPWSAQGPLISRLNAQLIGKTVGGYGDGTPLVQKDLGQIAANVILAVNAVADQGVRIGTIGPSSNGFVGPWHLKKAGEAIVELSQGLGGFDFELAPVEPVADAGGTKIAVFNAAAAIGTSQPAAIFEYGTGKRNLAGYRRPLDAAGMCNRGYHLAPGFPDSVEAGVTPILAASNATTIGRRRREDVVQADLQPDALRQTLLNETVRIRGYPRETIFITPTADADVAYGTHYKVGDLIEARATVAGRVRFDALFRIYGAQFAVSDLGAETVELALINEAAQI